jgi:hypothetical protein
MPLASCLLPEIPSGQPLSLFQPRNTWNTRKKRVDPPLSSFRVFSVFRGCALRRQEPMRGRLAEALEQQSTNLSVHPDLPPNASCVK